MDFALSREVNRQGQRNRAILSTDHIQLSINDMLASPR